MLGLFNVMGMFFGGVAILLPIFALVTKSKNILFSFVSLSLGVLSLYCIICEYNHLINVRDITALLDLSGFYTQLAFYILIVTLVLNLLVFKMNVRGKSNEK